MFRIVNPEYSGLRILNIQDSVPEHMLRDPVPEHMLRDLVPEHMLRDLVPDSPKPNLLLKRFYFSRTACDGFPCVQMPLYQIQKRPELKPDLLLSRFYFSSGSTFNVARV